MAALAGARLVTTLGVEGLSEYKSGMKAAAQETDAFAKKTNSSLRGVGDSMTATGRTMSRRLTAPLVGIGAVSLKMATDFNRGMANVSTMTDGSASRIKELKTVVQGMSVEMGKSTDDLADGMYQVLSAFGDTADGAKQLEVATKASVAGAATTTDAVNLLSAVTKGYGDTSVSAMEKASDLSFQTVRMGQTDFPQLAQSIGRVIPLAASLGVKQEELFGVMATATGVTGKAAEVSTQYRGILQSLTSPTAKMSELYKELGVKNGEQLIKQEGFADALTKITQKAKETNTPLQEYISSIEGQTLAMALTGPQADSFAEKLANMGDVAGSTQEAFELQTQGVNKAGFEMEQTKQKFIVASQSIGQALLPVAATVATTVGGMAQKFSELDPAIQGTIVTLGGIAAVAGPSLIVLGQMIVATQTLKTTLAGLSIASALTGPLGGVLAIAGLAAVAITAVKTSSRDAGNAAQIASGQIRGMNEAMRQAQGDALTATQATLNVKRSRNDLALAEQELQRIRKDGSATSGEVTRAELAVEQASIDLESAKRRESEATKASRESNREWAKSIGDTATPVDTLKARLKDLKSEMDSMGAGRGRSSAWRAMNREAKDLETSIENLESKYGTLGEQGRLQMALLAEATNDPERGFADVVVATDNLIRKLGSIPRTVDVSLNINQKVINSGPVSAISRGRMTGFNDGGLIPGGGPDKDTVIAALTPGEYVVPRKTVKRVGSKFLRSLDGYNSGGVVERRQRGEDQWRQFEGRYSNTRSKYDYQLSRAKGTRRTSDDITAYRALIRLNTRYLKMARRWRPRKGGLMSSDITANKNRMRAQLTDQLGSWRGEINSIKRAEQDRKKRQAESQLKKEHDKENLRREALGLESIEAEKHRQQLNEIRVANGLAPLEFSGSGGGSDTENIEAMLLQANRKAEQEKTRADLSEKALRAFSSSNDIGYGGGSNAFEAAGGAQNVTINNINALSGYDPAIQTALADTSNSGNSIGENADRLYSGRQEVAA